MKNRKPVPVKSAATRRNAAHFDALENVFLGIGTNRDKVAAGYFCAKPPLQDAVQDALYYDDDLGAKIVNARPEAMFRAGYTLCSESKPEEAEKLQEAAARLLDIDTKLQRAFMRGRLRGGHLLLIGADDSPDLSEPLDPKRARNILYLNPIEKKQASILTYQEDPQKPGYLEPELYTITSQAGSLVVHASRLLRFEGVPETDPDKRRAMAGWTYSVLQRPYDTLVEFTTGMKGVARLLADASQGVFKLRDLIESLAQDKNALQERLRILDMNRSSGRAIFVDAEDEDFTRVPTSFSGVDNAVDRLMMRLASAADMPVTLLMGRSPAGMNATGDSDFRAWYDTVTSEQKKVLRPLLLKIYGILSGGTIEDLDVDFAPLWTPSDQEQATTEKLRAEKFKIWTVDIAGITPQQAAIAEFGGGDGTVDIDVEAMQKEHTGEVDGLDLGEDVAQEPVDLTDPSTMPKPQDPNAKPAKPGAGATSSAPVAGGPSAGKGPGTGLITATDVASIVTVNEARASLGLPPKEGPEGEMTVAEYKAVKEASGAVVGKETGAVDAEEITGKPVAPPMPPGGMLPGQKPGAPVAPGAKATLDEPVNAKPKPSK